MSTTQQPTVMVWQNAADPTRVLIAWPDGRVTIVNNGGYIEEKPEAESPDHWIRIGKQPAGTLRGSLAIDPSQVPRLNAANIKR